jgi:hypothetical protein
MMSPWFLKKKKNFQHPVYLFSFYGAAAHRQAAIM